MTDYSAGFQRWWATYPAHRRREKPKCFEVWQKCKLEDRAAEVIEKLQADVSFDPSWQRDDKGKQFIPLSKTYLNGGRYDDDKPRPPRAVAPVHQDLPNQKLETDAYVRSVKKVALPWLMRSGGLPEERMSKFVELIHSLADEARELHGQDKLTDTYAQVIRQELNDFKARGTI